LKEWKSNVRLDNVSEQWMTLSVAGPNSGQLMAQLTGVNENEWKFMDSKNVNKCAK